MRSRLLIPLLVLLPLGVSAQEPRVNVRNGGADFNRLVLNAIDTMPSKGGYATNAGANQRLAAAVRIDTQGLTLSPKTAQPSYCSGATYQVFVAAVDQLVRRGSVSLDTRTLQALLVRGQRDGEGIWGRWNANGPGTARLFTEAGLGKNFTDMKQARPGDFLKIWWNDEIGKLERGHSVVFLGADADGVTFWSSNQPDGYGRKTVPHSKVKWALFSRFENPNALDRLAQLPRTDAYLASMLTHSSSRAEVAKRCDFRE